MVRPININQKQRQAASMQMKIKSQWIIEEGCYNVYSLCILALILITIMLLLFS
jgi:hypothetical protein